MTINQLAEYMEWENVNRAIPKVLEFLVAPHPRVRWAAINVIGQTATDHGKQLRKKYLKEVYEGLIKCLGDTNIRILTHACGATVNFCSVPQEDCTNEETPYLEAVLDRLHKILTSESMIKLDLIAQCTTAIASVAELSKQ